MTGPRPLTRRKRLLILSVARQCKAASAACKLAALLPWARLVHLTATPPCLAPDPLHHLSGLHRDRARAPTVLLLNSDDQQALRHALPALGELPTAGMPLVGSAAALPALGWQLPAARGAVQQLLAAGEWLQVRARGRGCCVGKRQGRRLERHLPRQHGVGGWWAKYWGFAWSPLRPLARAAAVLAAMCRSPCRLRACPASSPPSRLLPWSNAGAPSHFAANLICFLVDHPHLLPWPAWLCRRACKRRSTPTCR